MNAPTTGATSTGKRGAGPIGQCVTCSCRGFIGGLPKLGASKRLSPGPTIPLNQALIEHYEQSVRRLP
jgi:hypothetical protein